MTVLRFIGVAVVLSAALAKPAHAQPVIQEPGACAFYHPNGDLGIGSAVPSARAMAMMPGPGGNLSGLQMFVRLRSPVAGRQSPGMR